MVDAEPMGKYISYPHRAATFHVPMGIYVLTSQLRNGKRLGNLSLCSKNWVSNFNKNQFCLEIKMQRLGANSGGQLWGPTLGANSVLFRNQDADYRCVVRIGFQILIKFNFV